MSNPKGTPENLIQAQRIGAEALASKPLCVKVSVEVDEWVRSLDNPSAWLRDVITKAVQHERGQNV